MIKTVELGDQDNSHDEQGDAKGLDQEPFRLLLVLIGALETDIDVRIKLLGRHPGPDFVDFVIGQQTFGNAGLNLYDPLAIATLDQAGALLRRARDKVRDRHLAMRGLHPKGIKLADIAVFDRETDANFDFFIRIIGAVFTDLDAVGDKLHHLAHGQDIGIETPRLGPVHLHLPFNARQDAAVFHVQQAIHSLQPGAEFLDDRVQALGKAGADFDLNVLARGWAYVRLPRLHPNAGQMSRALAHLRHDLGRGTAFVPLSEFNKNSADHVLGLILTPGGTSGPGIYGAHTPNAHQFSLDLSDQAVLFPR